MHAMNVVNANVDSPNEDILHNDAILDGEEEVSIDNDEDSDADDSDEDYRFEWDGPNKIVVSVESNETSKMDAVNDPDQNRVSTRQLD